MMKQLFASHTAGWMVLSALLLASGHLAGCDTSAPSKKASETEISRPTAPSSPQALGSDGAKKAEAAPEETAQKELKQGESDQATKDLGSSETSSAAPDAAPLVKRLVIASEIKEREPVELTEAKVDEPVVAFVELKNSEAVETGVIVTFEHEGGHKVGFVELNVPGNSPRFRTWARTRNIKKAGEWSAVVKTKSGEELARTTFQVAG